MSNLDDSEYYEVGLEHIAESLNDLKYLSNNLKSCESFLKIINYTFRNAINILILMGKCNHDLVRPIEFRCSTGVASHNPVYDPLTDSHEELRMLILNCEKCKNMPSTDALFPNSSICFELETEYFRRKQNEDKISLIECIGREVAIRNNYVENREMAQKNKQRFNSKRVVFKSRGKEPIYLSIDFESGGFEVFDHKLEHLGQFSFGGEKIKEADSINHQLIE
ncbi:hypothetical protein [Sporomusa sp. GT1]|uniref:hypothetical protein n=1 Tax=Sporomusa sp. GT1 TaxID=1534747 RepID=UPI001667B010|nr:hypothetical protein [Sporomusa sp. GT1]